MNICDIKCLLCFQLIPPRGCAFVCMTKRKDTTKALEKLKGAKLLGNTLKVHRSDNHTRKLAFTLLSFHY